MPSPFGPSSTLRTTLYVYGLGIATAVGLATGVLGSLKTVLFLFGLEADSTHSLMLWDGISSHGFGWISDWKFTQDNWLLSLLPLHFLAFSLVGPKVSIVLVLGWVIFVSSALSVGVIAWRLGLRTAAVASTVVLLNLSGFAHMRGFVSFSTSHNVTNLFGLLCVLTIVQWFESRSALLLGLISLLLMAGAISDPWMLASYVAPIGILGIGLIVLSESRRRRIDGLALTTVAALATIAVYTKLCGLLWFLPDAGIKMGSAAMMRHNLLYLVRDLAGLFADVAPCRATCAPSLFVAVPILLSVAVLACLSAARLVAIGRAFHSVFIPLLVLGLLSSSIVAFAFVAMGEPAQAYSARFLINVPFFVVFSIATLAEMSWRSFAWPYRYTLLFCVVSVVAMNMAGNWHYLTVPGFHFRNTGAIAAASYLQANDLTYGYSPYWGGDIYASDWAEGTANISVEGWGANVLTVASNFTLRVRPVSFSRTTGYMTTGVRPAVAKSWYEPGDVPPGTRNYFVVVVPDVEECPDSDLCVSALKKQFGSPSEVLHRGRATILVWRHELLKFEGPVLRVTLGKHYRFDERGEFPAGRGWSVPEAWGVWSDGPAASLLVDFAGVSKAPDNMTIRARSFLTEKYPTKTVEVRLAGELIGHLHFTLDQNEYTREFPIPPNVQAKLGAESRLQFTIHDPISPMEAGVSADPRQLGVGLISVQFD